MPARERHALRRIAQHVPRADVVEDVEEARAQLLFRARGPHATPGRARDLREERVLRVALLSGLHGVDEGLGARRGLDDLSRGQPAQGIETVAEDDHHRAAWAGLE